MIPDHVARAVRDKRVIILEDGSVYDRDYIPLELLIDVDEFMLEIRELIAMSDTRLCPAPDLHRKEWHRIPHEQLYYCAVCKRIRESISTSLSQLSSEKKLMAGYIFMSNGCR
jgi:hypothetical protein